MSDDWKNNIELANALLNAIKQYSVAFTPNTSNDGLVSQLYYGSPALLSEDSKGSLNFYSHNANSIFGYSTDEAVGMASELLAPENLRSGREELFAEIIAQNQLREVETVRIHKRGHEVRIAAQVFPYVVNGEHSIAAVVKRLE